MENNRPEELLEDLEKMSDQELLQFLSDTGELERIAELVNDFIETIDKAIEERPNSMDVLLPLYRFEDLDANSDFVRFAWNLTPDTVAAVTGGRVKYTRKRKNRIKGAIELLHDITIGEACELVRLTLFTDGVDIKTPPSNARELYLEAIEEIDARDSGRAPEPKRKKASEAIVLANTGLFAKIGSGPALDLLFQTLSTKGDPTRAIYDKGGRVTTSGKRNSISLKSPASDVTIEIPDVDKLAKSNKGAKKILIYLLEKIGEQALNEGVMYNNKIIFNVQELVDKGIYKTFQSAVKGFQDSMDPLGTFQIKGEVRKSKKSTATQKITATMFPTMNYDRGKCSISLNQDLNWDFAIPFSMLLPQYYYSLNQKAADLTYLISYLARQRAEEIKETGCFKIKLRTVQARLNLPDETTAKQPRRDILEVIDKAMEEIEGASKSRDFTITMEAKIGNKDITQCSTAEILDNGYLRVELKGDYAQDFIAIAEKGQAHKQKVARLQAKAEAEHEAKTKRRKEKD